MPTLNKASIWNTEPVTILAAAAIAVINGGLQVLGAFGVVVTSAQATSIGVFVTAIVALVALVMRSQVVPVNAPDGPQRLMKARLSRGLANDAGGANAARSPYREPAAVTVPAPMLADLPRWAHGHLLPAMLAVSVASLFIWGCTPGEIQVAHGVITVGGQVCEDVLTATDPTLAPLCVTAAEVAEAILELTQEQQAAARAAGKVGAELQVAPPSRDAQYHRVVANRAKKGIHK